MEKEAGSLISQELMRTVLNRYTLPQQGAHGVTHWGRVIENGTLLAQKTGAVIKVVQLFAVFHDSQRINERRDPEHGLRGAELALELWGSLFDVPDGDIDLLYFACANHTHGSTAVDVTVRTCWDADRLDLGRVGIKPDPRLLCTSAARDPKVIAWAYERGLARVVPDFVRSEWEITGLS
jgi:uncharacterized protein